MRARLGWGQPPTGWLQPTLPGWAPLIDPGPLPLQAARSVGRWFWPTLAVSGFVAVVAYSFAHDDPAPGLSQRGLVTVALAAAVVVLLTLHRRYGPGPLARALAEYTVVAVLAGLLAATGTGAGVDQQPADHAAPAKADETKARPEAKPRAKAAVGDDRPAVLQVPAKVIRAVTGAVGWLIDLWHQASQRTEPANGQAMAARPLSPLPSPPSPRLLLVLEEPMTKFRHLPGAGRAIIIVIAIGVLAIAVVACATSYNAIYRLVGQLGLYGYRINQAFPLLLDAAFLVAELAAILGGIMRAVTRSDEVSAGWPGAAMLLCGLGTIGFNVGHAYLLGGRGDP